MRDTGIMDTIIRITDIGDIFFLVQISKTSAIFSILRNRIAWSRNVFYILPKFTILLFPSRVVNVEDI